MDERVLQDFGREVLEAVDRGIPRKEVVRIFGVSIATIGILFLPAYWPTEKAFPEIGAIQRRIEARTREASIEATGVARDAAGRQDALGWFRHRGYGMVRPSIRKRFKPAG